MSYPLRWDPCIAHREHEVASFVQSYFSDPSRSVLFVAGAGFDPRSATIGELVAPSCANVRAFLIKENRPNPQQSEIDQAEENRSKLERIFPQRNVERIDIFGSDGAVVGGRNVIARLDSQDFSEITDVIVDVSALSIGTSFPVIKYFVERVDRGIGPRNVHLFVAHEASLDEAIVPVASDAPGYVHGFKGPATLERTSQVAKLWLPQLARERRAVLSRLHGFVDPHDTCPILPFPASDPRLSDDLAAHFLAEFENAWSVDARNIVYAAEDDPLDLYRTILRLDDLRRPVFDEFGGSLLVLSPVGSKIMALGALLAALERDLPVAYLEAIGYDLRNPALSDSPRTFLVHVWLEGDAYPRPRPNLKRQYDLAG